MYAGHPTPKNSVELLIDINEVYAPMQYIVSALGRVGLVSSRMVNLFERLRRDWGVVFKLT